MLEICWSPGKVQVSVQPLTGAVPALVSPTWPWNPPDQLFVRE
jgi:hypothetical protein